MSDRESGPHSPAARSANAIWRRRVDEFPDRAAFRFRRDEKWHTLTWKEADRTAREIAAGLCSLGLAPGDRVAILCQTRVEWVLCDVAITLAGLVSVPIYPSTTAEQSAYVRPGREAGRPGRPQAVLPCSANRRGWRSRGNRPIRSLLLG
jgi:long-subunit acyl-CoA synthetase (AMP-forming)